MKLDKFNKIIAETTQQTREIISLEMNLLEAKDKLKERYYGIYTKGWDNDLLIQYGGEVEEHFNSWWEGYIYGISNPVPAK